MNQEPDSVDRAVGSALRRLRVQAGWTAARLAAAGGLTARELADVEDGRRRLRACEMMEVARSLELRPHDFYVDLGCGGATGASAP